MGVGDSSFGVGGMGGGEGKIEVRVSEFEEGGDGDSVEGEVNVEGDVKEVNRDVRNGRSELGEEGENKKGKR